MTFVVVGTITLSSFGMYFSDSFQRFGNSIAEKLIVDWHIYMPKGE
jgi:hypothetical protein